MSQIDDKGAYRVLREANEARQIEWSNGAKDGPLFYAVELFGESGELANVIKKVERERLGMVGSRSSLGDLADELADYFICIDLLAIAYRLPALEATQFVSGDISSPTFKTVALGRAVGCVLSAVERVEMTRLVGMTKAGSYLERQNLSEVLSNAAGYAFSLAKEYDISLRDAVIAKFNKTSEKYELATRLSNDARIG